MKYQNVIIVSFQTTKNIQLALLFILWLKLKSIISFISTEQNAEFFVKTNHTGQQNLHLIVNISSHKRLYVRMASSNHHGTKRV